jgi:hypothetical protein
LHNNFSPDIGHDARPARATRSIRATLDHHVVPPLGFEGFDHRRIDVSVVIVVTAERRKIAFPAATG